MRVIDIINQAVEESGIGRRGEIKSKTKDLVLDKLNTIYESIYTVHPWREAKIFNLSVTTTDGIVTLPYYVDTIRAARTGSNLPLVPINEVKLNLVAPESFDNTGSPSRFMHLSKSPVETQPSSASAITIASSSASDSTGIVRFEGFVSDVLDREEVSLNGTSDVTTTKVFTSITEITKPLTTGRITVKEGSTTIGTIHPDDYSPRYQRIQLVPKVDSSTNVVFQCDRKFERFVSDNDSPVMEGVGSALFALLTADCYLYIKDIEMSSQWQKIGEDRLKILLERQDKIDESDRVVVPMMGMFGDLGEHTNIIDLSPTGRLY